MSVPKSLKDKLWNAQFGVTVGVGYCFVCENEIYSRSFEAGHIRSRKDGGPTNLENLKCICSVCNKSMGSQNMYEYKKVYFEKDREIRSKIVLENVVEGWFNKIVSSDTLGRIVNNDNEWLHFYVYYEELCKKRDFERNKIKVRKRKNRLEYKII